jgi:S-(hydroxymethyl)glutathione dehydrogenase/alcohol dehydrogenase
VALRSGATHAVTPDGLAEIRGLLTAGRGFDYAFEAVGRSQTLTAAFQAARRGAKVIVVGAGAVDDQFQLDMFSLLFEGKDLIPSIYGSSDMARDVRLYTDLWRQGKLDLETVISGRIKFEELNDALGALSRGEVIRQVVMFDD